MMIFKEDTKAKKKKAKQPRPNPKNPTKLNQPTNTPLALPPKKARKGITQKSFPTVIKM